MGMKPDSEVKQTTFVGMTSNLNPRDLRPGQAFLQINVTAVRHGVLSVRQGLREVTFDNSFQ